LSPSAEELQKEAIWIFQRLVQDKNKEEFTNNTDAIQNKIQRVLHLIRVEHLDVPMVATYRKYEYQKDLTDEDVWTIFDLDLEYGKYTQEKNQIQRFLQ